MTAILIASSEQWHTLRSQHIGGSEVAALFGEHEHGLTKFQLWHRKKVPERFLPSKQTERMKAGNYLEPAIAKWVADQTGWTIRKVHVYHSLLPGLGLGGSLDFEIVANERGPGVLEIKTADWLVAKRWEDGEPPLSYMLQLQTYLACMGRSWGCIAVLVGGNDLRLFEIERRPATIELIEKAVADFWQSIRDNKPPPPDFAKDGATLAQLYAAAEPGKIIDMSDSNRLPELIAEYRRASAEEKAGKAAKDAAKAEMLPLIGDAERVICGDATISAKMVAGTHVEYERKPFRDFRINEKKAKSDG